MISEAMREFLRQTRAKKEAKNLSKVCRDYVQQAQFQIAERHHAKGYGGSDVILETPRGMVRKVQCGMPVRSNDLDRVRRCRNLVDPPLTVCGDCTVSLLDGELDDVDAADLFTQRKRARLVNDHSVRGWAAKIGPKSVVLEFDGSIKTPLGRLYSRNYKGREVELESAPCPCRECFLVRVKERPPTLAQRRWGIFFRWA